MSKYVTTREAASLLGLCHQRIRQKIEKGHFADVVACPCGRGFLIPRVSLKQSNPTTRATRPVLRGTVRRV